MVEFEAGVEKPPYGSAWQMEQVGIAHGVNVIPPQLPLDHGAFTDPAAKRDSREHDHATDAVERTYLQESVSDIDPRFFRGVCCLLVLRRKARERRAVCTSRDQMVGLLLSGDRRWRRVRASYAVHRRGSDQRDVSLYAAAICARSIWDNVASFLYGAVRHLQVRRKVTT